MRAIVIRGGGDLATGVAHRLSKSGYSVIILEHTRPSAIRRQVAFSQAVYEGQSCVEGILCRKAATPKEALQIAAPLRPALLVDPEGKAIPVLKPDILIDAMIAKANLGTRKDMAKLTIALGPGFEAGKDVDYVIETKRGHYLGRIIEKGSAIPNTGVPGIIGGYGKERVIHAQYAGVFHGDYGIGDWVESGWTIGKIIDENGCEHLVKTEISGVLRGILPDRYPVTKGFKMADVDPRAESAAHCALISDKARCLGGSVLELVCAFEKGCL
ncbi:MAG: selenium-dependent molybdenum cofactor biosynthesis protein YqeB [Blautia sp.]